MPAELISTLNRLGVVAVLRGDDPHSVVEKGIELVGAGVAALEVTFTVPDCESAIRHLCTVPGAVVGAGTVLDRQSAEAALDAGARFLVSPVSPVEVVELIGEVDAVIVPGAATPQEIIRCLDSGAEVVKVFPIGAYGGPRYLRQLSGPFPDLRIMASGGIEVDEVPSYLEAGAWCVGLGSSITHAPARRLQTLVKGLATRQR